MRIVRYIVSVLMLLALLQAAYTVLVIRFAAPTIVDTNFSRRGIFQTDSKMAVYASPIVARGSENPQIVILGSSNTTMGLRPDKLQPYVGDVLIHNLSIGSEKFRDIAQLVDLLYRQTLPPQRKNYTFVIGLSYPLIADESKERHGQTSVDDEEQRFYLFRKDGRNSLPRMHDEYIACALQMAWPFLTPKALYNGLIHQLPEPYWFGLAEPVPFSAEESNRVQYTETQHQERITYYNSEAIDTTGEYTFDPLLKTIARITSEGGEVVIVDLPTAKWLQDATPVYATYKKLRARYISRLEKMPHVRYINAESGFVDDNFYDGIHPRNRITGEIASKVGPTIKHALEDAR